MGVPDRTDANTYDSIAKQSGASCPDQQYPIGFGGRSSCWGIADFRVNP